MQKYYKKMTFCEKKSLILLIILIINYMQIQFIYKKNIF